MSGLIVFGVLATGLVTALVQPVGASPGGALAETASTTANGAIDTAGSTATSTANEALAMVYPGVGPIPAIPPGARLKVGYNPAGYFFAWIDANNNNQVDGGETVLLSSQIAPVNPRIRDAAPGDNGRLCFTIWNDANDNNATDAGETTQQACEVLPLSRVQVEFYNGTVQTSVGPPPTTSCSGAQLARTNVTIDVPPIVEPGLPAAPTQVQCVTVRAFNGTGGQVGAASAGVPSPVATAGARVTFYDGDFADGQCEGMAVGNVSLSILPPGAPTVDPPGASTRCATVNVTVDPDGPGGGDPTSIEQSGGVPPPTPLAVVRAEFYNGTLAVGPPPACTGSQIGSLQVNVSTVPGLDVGNLPGSPVDTRCVTVRAFNATGVELANASVGVPDLPPPPPVNTTASARVTFFNGTFNATAMKCTGTEAGSVALNLLPAGVPNITLPSAEARCARVNVTTDPDGPGGPEPATSAEADAGVPEGVPVPRVDAASVRAEFYNGTLAVGPPPACTGSQIGSLQVNVSTVPGLDVGNLPGSPVDTRCVTVRAFNATGVELANASVGVPDLPPPPPVNTTASARVTFFNGTFDPGTQRCTGSEVGRVHVSVLPAGAPNVTAPSTDVRCARINLTADPDGPDGAQAATSAEADAGAPPTPEANLATVRARFYNGTLAVDLEEDQGTSCRGSEIGSLQVNISTNPGVTSALPANPAETRCVNLQVFDGMGNVLANASLGVPELPPPPQVNATAGARVTFFNGTMSVDTSLTPPSTSCGGSEVGSVQLSLLPAGAPNITVPSADARCVRINLAADPDGPEGPMGAVSQNASAGAPTIVPPEGSVAIQLYNQSAVADGTPPASTSPAGQEGVRCMGTNFTAAIVPTSGSPTLPSGPQDARCARITVTTTAGTFRRDVGIVDPLDADGDGFSNLNELQPGPLGACQTLFERAVNWLITARTPADCDGDGFSNLDEFGFATAAHDGLFHPNHVPVISGGAATAFTVIEDEALVIPVAVTDSDLADCTNLSHSYPLFGNPTPLAVFDDPDLTLSTDPPIVPAPTLEEDGIHVDPGFATVLALGNLTVTITLNATDHGYSCGGDQGGEDPRSAQRDYTVTIVNDNDAPVLAAIGNRSALPGVPLMFDVTAADSFPAGDTLVLNASGLPPGANFTDDGNGMGNFSWTPTPSQLGTFNVTFSATDAAGLEDNEAIGIVVDNRAPILDLIGNRTVDENVTLNFTITASDPDGGALVLSATGVPDDGGSFVDHGDGTADFSWTPDFTASGLYNVTFSVTDVGGLTDDETITIEVVNINDPPVLNPIGNRTGAENATLEFTVSASDPFPVGDGLAMTADGLPGAATFTDHGNMTGTFSWTPGFTDAGPFNVTFTVTDAGNLTDVETIVITINNTNRAPTLAFDPAGAGTPERFDVSENGSVSFNITKADPDGEAVSLTLMAGALAGCNLESDTVTCAPGFNAVVHPATNATFNGTVSGEDTSGGSVSRDFQVHVEDVNRAPRIVFTPAGSGEPASFNVSENASVEFTVSTPDDDPEDAPALTALATPSFCSFDATSRNLTCSPTFDTVAHPATTLDAGGNFSADDAFANVSKDYAIHVVDVNRAPAVDVVARTDTCLTVAGNNRSFCYVFVGATLTVAVTASDADADALEFTFDFGDGTVVSGPNATVNHTFATANATGFTVDITVADAFGGSDPDGFTVAAYVAGDDNDGDTLTNAEELSGARNIRWALRPTDPDERDTDGDSVSIGMLVLSDGSDNVEIACGADPDNLDNTCGDADGDGISNEVDPNAERCGPVGLLVQFYRGEDATGNRVPAIRAAQEARSVRLVVLTNGNNDMDCDDADERTVVLTQNLPANAPPLGLSLSVGATFWDGAAAADGSSCTGAEVGGATATPPSGLSWRLPDPAQVRCAQASVGVDADGSGPLAPLSQASAVNMPT